MKPKTQAEQIEWAGQQAREAKTLAPQKYAQYLSLIQVEMKKEDIDPLEAAINICQQVNDSVAHLWLLGVAANMIEESGHVILKK
jgi:hypothetical protein